MTVDNLAVPTGSRVKITPCLTGEPSAQQFEMFDVNVETASFKIRHKPSELCLTPSGSSGYLQSCGDSANLFSIP